MSRTAPPACRVQPPARQSLHAGLVEVTRPYTAFLRDGEALKRTVLPAFTLIDSPVRGLRPLRALVLRTVKVPKLGRVNLPSFFNALTTASINSPAVRLAAVPVSDADSCSTWAIKAFD